MIRSIVFNAIVFLSACFLLYKAKSKPEFKPGMVSLSLLLYLINVRCVVQMLLAWADREKKKKRQEANIVTGYCPDYWVKDINQKKEVVCKPRYTKQRKGTTTEYNFGKNEINLEDINKMSNVEKCRFVEDNKIAWLDMQRKCRGSI
jgi:hypothetical protein